MSCCVSPLPRRLDRGNDLVLERARRDRADVLVDDLPLAVDDEGLRHAVDTPFDGGAPVAVCADGGERIAVAAQEATRSGRLVLVVDAEYGGARALLQS